MIRGIQLIFLALLMTQPSTGWSQGYPEDGKEAISKILNPLPDYDPFSDRSLPTPEFFPDEIEKRIRQVLIDSLTEPEKSLQGHVRFFKERDSELIGERNTVTGLTDHVLDLHLNTLRSRTEYLAAQKEALGSATSENQKRLIQSRIRNDELTRANELLRKSRTNRAGALANRLLRSVDLMEIAAGSYLPAVVDSTVSQLLELRGSEMPVEERKALALYRQYLDRYPKDPQREKIEKVVEALEKKKREVQVHRHLQKGKEALEKGEFTRAEFQYQMASMIDPESKKSKKGFDELKKHLKAQEEERRNAPSLPEPSSDKDATPLSDWDLSNLLYALALRDTQKVEVHAHAVEKRYHDTAIGESARDALAVSMDIQGRHEEAKRLLHKLARSSKSPYQRKKAEELLRSPDYNRLGMVQKARSRHRIQTIKYILLGENFLEKNLLLGARPLMVHSLGAVNTWGMVNLIFVGTNLFQVLTSQPVSDQPIIDKAVAYIRSHPESDSATEVYTLLAKAYEARGDYAKAITYYKMSGEVSKERIADLQETAANRLLKGAEESQKRRVKEFYLRAILNFYPETSAVKEARGRLAGLLKAKNRGAKISKQFLLKNPALYGGKGLGLKPSLFDGEISNMELADKGLNLLSEDEILLHFQTPWGVQSQSYLVKAEIIHRFQRALRKRHYEIALGDVHTRTKGSRGGIDNLPVKLPKKNGTGTKPDGNSPHLTLVKRATGSSPAYPPYPKVLDYELFSENEKGTGKKFQLPQLQGSVSTNHFDISGELPTALWGNRVSFGSDAKSPFAGLQLAIPLLQDFIPVDFLVQGRLGQTSLIPQIHRFQNKDEKEDDSLFR